MRPFCPVLLLCAVLASGCARELSHAPDANAPSSRNAPEDAARSSVRDSSGVRIVESRSPSWGPLQRWTVEPVPELQLGVRDGDPAQLFSASLDAAFGPDGVIAVLNGRPPEVRLFDSAGLHLASFGAAGQGPGEFSGGADHVVFGTGDTIVIASAYRVYWFQADGTYLKQLDLRTGPPSPRVIDVLGDGTLLRSVVRNGEALGVEGVRRAIHDIELLTEGGRRIASIGEIGMFESFTTRSQDGHSFGGLNVFGSRNEVAGRTAPVRAFVADAHRWELRAYDSTGALEEILRLGAPRTPITQTLVRRIRASADSAYENRPGYSEARSRLLSLYADLTIPDSLPAIRRVFWDEEGYLWLERNDVSVFSFSLPRTFEVLAADGTWLGSVDVPFYQIYQISRGRILAGHHDELGVPYVRVYRIRKGVSP